MRIDDLGGPRIDPPYFVVVNKEVHAARGLPDSIELLQDADVGEYFPVFTEELFAWRAIKASKIRDVAKVEVVRVTGANQLHDYLDLYERAGGKHVGLDVAGTGHDAGWVLGIPTFRSRLPARA